MVILVLWIRADIIFDSKMEADYQNNSQFGEEYLRNIDLHIPEWAKTLVDLYTSPLKYKIKYELEKAK